MQNRPDVNNPFYSVYQVAEHLCADLPAGTELSQTCIVGTIGGYSLAERARVERSEMLPAVIAIIILLVVIRMWQRHKAVSRLKLS